MALAVRVIPTLLCRGVGLYKGERFDSWRQVGHVMQAVRTHQARGVDELIMLDIGATPEWRGPDFSMIEELARDCFMPLTVGGGVRSVEDVRRLLECGADKVSICTGSSRAIQEAAALFGRQAIVAAIDVGPDGMAHVRCGASSTGLAAVPLANKYAEDGAGEILLTSIDREGTMHGYDLDLIRAVSQTVNIPVIAHGGCSSYEDMLKAIEAGASAVAAGAMFQFTDQTPKGAAQYLAGKGIEVRL